MNDHSSLVLQHFGIIREGQEEAAKLLVAQFINSGILSNSIPKMVEPQSFNPTTSAFISNTTHFDCCTPSHSSAASSFSASSSPSSPMRSSTPSSSDREYSSPADHQIRCRWGHCCRHFGSSEPFLEHVRLDHLVQLHLSNGQRQFTCLWKDCERGERPFSAIYMLVQHLRAHTGEKPYKCEWINCEKRYSRLENLKTHQRKHTGERPYQCSLCDRSFTNASDKAKHINRVHKEKKQYLCTVAGCDSAYTDPSSLRKHTLASHGTSPWLEYKARRRNVRRIQNDRTEGDKATPFE